MPADDYIHLFRRRREGKTDYRKRRGMIVGRLPFLAVRVSGRYIYAQIIKATPQGDLTLCTASSRDLTKFGWKGAAKNLPSAYLTGYYLGKISHGNNLENLVFYSGVGRFVHGSRVASLIRGAKEAGLEVTVGENSLPDDDRIRGSHVAVYARKLETEDKEKLSRVFSKVLASGSNPTNYPSDFDKVKLAIDNGAKN